jgi:RimJ/RimL family protein N-acetyltransferase
MEIFTGEPLFLRPLDREHLPACLRWFHEDPDVLRYLNWNLPLSTEATEDRFLERVQDSETNHVFALILSQNAEHIGTIGIHDIDARNRKATMGIYLSEPWRDQGLGRVAIAKLLSFCFDVRNLHRVELRVWSYNARAKSCYVACGFHQEGVWDEEVYAILEGEFRARAAELASD